jgi:hypothetical protein
MVMYDLENVTNESKMMMISFTLITPLLLLLYMTALIGIHHNCTDYAS